MVIGLGAWQVRYKDIFSKADQCGASVAHTELVKASLEYEIVDAVSIFLAPTYMACAENRKGRDLLDGSANDLLERFGSRRVSIHPLLLLHKEFAMPNSIFLVGAPAIAPLAAVRSRLNSHPFPICGVLHAVNWDSLLALYTYTKLLCEPYDVLVATSEAGKKAVLSAFEQTEVLLTKRFGIRTAARHEFVPEIVKIPLGVDETYMCPRDKVICREAIDIPSGKTVILYLGRLTETYKADLEPLVMAVAELSKRHPDLLLLLCGQDLGEDYARLLERLSTKLRVNSKIRIITNFSFSMKPILYSSADIFISPVDNIQETFGLSVLEAMASELPVIASDWSGYRDIIEHGKTGFLIPTYWSPDAGDIISAYGSVLPGQLKEYYLAQRTIVDQRALHNYLELLIENPDLRRQLGQAGRQSIINHYSWRIATKKFGDLWKQQIKSCQSLTPDLPSRKPIFDYNGMFAHYATEVISGDHIVVAPEDMNGNNDAICLRAASSRLKVDDVMRVKTDCQEAGRPLKELLQIRGKGTMDAILWLAKKGYCHIRPPSV